MKVLVLVSFLYVIADVKPSPIYESYEDINESFIYEPNINLNYDDNDSYLYISDDSFQNKVFETNVNNNYKSGEDNYDYLPKFVTPDFYGNYEDNNQVCSFIF